MKKIAIILLLAATIISVGCEDAIYVNTDTAAPRLVVDASLNWQKGTAGNEQRIRLSMTTNYYEQTSPPASGATVFVMNSEDETFDFIETPNTGEYICSTFIPQIGETYTLTIVHNGRTLTAVEEMQAVPPIDYVAQEIKPGIGGEEDLIQVKSYFTDSALSRNFYMLRFKSTLNAIPEFDVFDDEFFQGNQVFGIYINPDTTPGDIIETKLYGISQRYMDYMIKLLNIAENMGPFSTPPAILRGNIVNTTNPDDYVLGYFTVSEMDTAVYTVQ